MKTMRMCVLAAGLAMGAQTSAQTYDFSSLVHGEIVTNQFEPALQIIGTNPNRAFDIVAGFDTSITGPTSDPDLQGPPWAGGNLAIDDDNVDLGVALILAQNDRDIDNDGILEHPNDEGNRPAGTLDLRFANAIPAFGFDVVDIEGTVSEMSSLDFYLGGVLLGSVDLMDFVDNANALYDPSIVFGDNHANRFQPVSAAHFNAAGFDRVVINVGGSSAWDTFVVVPAPASAMLIGLGGLAAARRRR